MCILKSKSLDLQMPNFVWPLQLDELHTVKTSGWQVVLSREERAGASAWASARNV